MRKTDGTVEVTAFEHLAGFKEEREAFRKVLSQRLDKFLGLIEERASGSGQAPA